MNDSTADVIEAGRVPVIDIAPLCDGSGELAVAEALHRASHEIGFIYVSNHGIDTTFLADARETALSFFRRSAQDKQEVSISAKHRGYLKIGAARMQDDARPDLKESFVWGYEDADGRTPDDHALRGANRWPSGMPEMRTAAMRFFTEAEGVAKHLLRGFAMGLGLDQQFFLRSSTQPMSRASFTYYPHQIASLGDRQCGVSPHTDFGVLTVLCQDDVGGLQVQDAGGNWVPAPPIPGTLVINVGDLLARWTNGHYRSTPHRVINESGRERLSLVLAFDPDPSTVVDSRQVFPNQTDCAEPITCGDYLEWRFAKSFDYRKRD